MEYNYLYDGKNFEEIKQKLYAEIQSALLEKYGENPDPIILKRIKEEWSFLKKYHSIEEVWKVAPKQQLIATFAFIHDLGRWLRHNNYPYWNRGTGASSFILYLLNVSFVNPLPAHYHCPHCHQIYWKNIEYKDGFDLPPTAKCKHDNTQLIADGHDIPWQSLFKYPTHAFHFDIDTTEDAKENLLLFLKQSWLSKLNPNITVEIPYPQHRPSIIHYYSLTIDCHIKGNHPDFFTNPIDSSCKTLALRAWQETIKLEQATEAPTLPEPFTFADLIYIYGLHGSTGVWDENADALISNFGYSPSDLIAFRDDIFQYFVNHNIPQRQAYVMSDQVRRGFLFKKLPLRLYTSKDKWVLERIKKIVYLFPKAHVLEWVFFALKTKIKETKQLYKAPYTHNEINIRLSDNTLTLPITNANLLELTQRLKKMVEIFHNILGRYYHNAHMSFTLPDIVFTSEQCFDSYITEENVKSIPLSCQYGHGANQIFLYINNIHEQFKHAPTSDVTSKLVAGIEISIAHALSTAIFFYFMGETYDLRQRNWHKSLKNSVKKSFSADVKGFGRWFEYVWCKENITASKVYQWHIEQIKEEALSNSEHNYPYFTVADILLNENEFMEDIYINGEAISLLRHNTKRKDVIYWDEINYQ